MNFEFSCKNWDEFDQMVEDAVVNGSSVLEAGILWPKYLDFGKWQRSKEKKGGQNPFGSYMLNKKWSLEEEFNNHMLRFQQVTVSSIFILVNYILTFQAGLVAIEVPFKVEAPDDEPEPLAMEHFYFPLGLWLAGLLVSVIFLLAEIINKYRVNQQ